MQKSANVCVCMFCMCAMHLQSVSAEWEMAKSTNTCAPYVVKGNGSPLGWLSTALWTTRLMESTSFRMTWIWQSEVFVIIWHFVPIKLTQTSELSWISSMPIKCPTNQPRSFNTFDHLLLRPTCGRPSRVNGFPRWKVIRKTIITWA